MGEEGRMNLYKGNPFYGENAKPISTKYSQTLQRRLYVQTAIMRGEIELTLDLIKYTFLNHLFCAILVKLLFLLLDRAVYL